MVHRYPGIRCMAAVLLSLAALATAAGPAAAAADPCAALSQAALEGAADRPVSIISARTVTDPVEALQSQFMFFKRSMVQGMPIMKDGKADYGRKELPVHCRVEGYIAPAIRFLALLPLAADWNGDVVLNGCDAFCNLLDEDPAVPGLLRGFAAMTTDGGHRGRPWFDGSWGYDNRSAEVDFGYLANHLAAQTVKALAAAYYGRPHRHAYLVGFSKGGHAGIKSALLFPRDFDGVLARSPVVRYQDINAIRLPYLYRINTRSDGTPILAARDAPLIHRAAIASCDAVDGASDGVIDDPRQCRFDPGVLLCQPGQGPADCLSAEQVATLRRIYSPPVNQHGQQTYPYPVEVGSELDWPGFVIGAADGETHQGEMLGRTWLRYLAFDQDPGPGFDWLGFDPIRDGAKLDALRPVYDADSGDLVRFHAAGGKMIVIHGWSDGAVSARMSVDWYEEVRRQMGPATDSFLRLYLVPGSKHGHGGDGPFVSESLRALQRWVEHDEAPQDLLFLQPDPQGNIVRSRALPPFSTPPRGADAGAGAAAGLRAACASSEQVQRIRQFFAEVEPGAPLPVASRHFELPEFTIASALADEHGSGALVTPATLPRIWSTIDAWGEQTRVTLVFAPHGQHAFAQPSLVPVTQPDDDDYLDVYADGGRGIHSHIRLQHVAAVWASDLPTAEPGFHTRAISLFDARGDLVVGVYASLKTQAPDPAAVRGFEQTRALLATLPHPCR